MKKQKVTIMLMVFLVFVGFGIVIPILPHVITVELKMADYHVQLMLAAYSLASFLVAPLWGGLSERIGRKPVMMMGLIGYSLSFLLYGLAIWWHAQGLIDNDTGLTLMYVSRVLAGFFSGATLAVAMAYMADITSDEERTKGMGLIGMSIGIGFIFGPGIGGLLSVGGLYWLPFIVSSALSLITLLMVARLLSESLTPEIREKALAERQQQTSRWLAFEGPVRNLYVLSFLATFVLAGLEGTLQLFLISKIEVTPTQMGAMFFISGIVGALMQGGFIQRYLKKGDEIKFMVVGFSLSGIAFLLFLASGSFWEATVFLCLFGIGNSLIRPCVTSLITQTSKVGHGISTGLNASVDSLGRIVGPLFAAVLFGLHVPFLEIKGAWPFIAGFVFCLLALVLVIRFKRRMAIEAANTESVTVS